MHKTSLLVACVGIWAIALGGCADSFGSTSTPALSPLTHRRAALDEDFGLTELPMGKASAHDFAVRVYRSGADRGAGSCSGALISPTKVVTALHCVVALNEKMELTDYVRDAADFHVEFGGDYLPWGRVPVIDVRTCGDYQPGAGAVHDVAVIELAEPAPADVPILRVASEPPMPGDSFASYGFGSEFSRALPLTPFKVESVRRHTRAHTATGVVPGALTLTGGTIHGDSGGPIVDRETGEIVAVVSEGSEQFGSADSVAPRAPAESGVLSVASIATPNAVTVGARLDACPMLFN